MSYDELSQARGIGRESAVKLVQAKRWRRMRGNDGTTRVLIPPEWLRPARKRSPEDSPEGSPESSPELSRAIRALEAGLAFAKEQIEQAEGRAGTLQAEVAAEKEARARAEAWADAEHQAFTRAEEGREAERRRADRAEARVRDVEADATEWWSRSRWRRIRAAWQGRR
jgi:hypothetical protein